jgi:hypothetical protein
MKRLFFALLLAAASPALAHTPTKLDPAATFTVKNTKVSVAFFGLFVTGEERFVISLSFAERYATTFEMLVPHQEQLKEHRPAYAIVGPGLQKPTAEELAALPAPLPAGWGAILVFDENTPRVALFESVMRRFYWTGGSTAVIFPKADLEVWVWSPKKTAGKFCLGYGIEEGGGGYENAFKDWAFYEY